MRKQDRIANQQQSQKEGDSQDSERMRGSSESERMRGRSESEAISSAETRRPQRHSGKLPLPD